MSWLPSRLNTDDDVESETLEIEGLLTVEEVAELLKVPKSWIYERTRRRGKERLPHIKLGKYIRFEERTLVRYLARNSV